MKRIVLGVVAALLLAAPASAQTIRGRVLDAGTGAGIPEARVTLLNAAGQRVTDVITDANGRFHLNAREAGGHRLRTSHIGYTDVTTEEVMVGTQEQVTVDVRLAIAAVTLEPLTVVARRPDPRHDATADGMYARRLSLPPLGSARVVLPHDPEMVNAIDVRDVLTWLPRTRGCVAVYWNGNLVLNQDLATEWLETSVALLEAVEFYRTPIEAPAAFRELPPYLGFENAFCSVIALWPRTNRYLAEFAPPLMPPDMSRETLTAIAYRIAGKHSPGIGAGIEGAVYRHLRPAIAIGAFARVTLHQLSADTMASLTRHMSAEFLPPGSRGFQLWVLGGESRVLFRRQERISPHVSGRVQVGQRRLSLQSAKVGNRDIGITSYGWGLGATAGAEWQVSTRLSANVALAHDWFDFAAYDRIETASTPTAATWNATSLRLGFVLRGQ